MCNTPFSVINEPLTLSCCVCDGLDSRMIFNNSYPDAAMHMYAKFHTNISPS